MEWHEARLVENLLSASVARLIAFDHSDLAIFVDIVTIKRLIKLLAAITSLRSLR